MRIRRCLHVCLTLLILLLVAPQCEGARRKKPEQLHTPDVEATVISLRRYQLSTYIEVLRDDGLQEWLEINREQGLQVKPDQRIVYSTRSEAHENTAFGKVRYGVDFRIIPRQHDDQIYRETAADGTPVFTDNPSVPRSAESSGTKKTNSKVSREQGIDEMIVVDQDELRKKAEMTEEYYRYLEQNNTDTYRPVRKAKRAKPRQN